MATHIFRVNFTEIDISVDTDAEVDTDALCEQIQLALDNAGVPTQQWASAISSRIEANSVDTDGGFFEVEFLETDD